MGSGIVDKAALIDSVGRSRELLEEITGMYNDERPALLRQLEEAINSGDVDAIHRKAHRLKGVFGSLAAENAFAVAGRIVDRARSGDLIGVRSGFEILTAEARKVEDELRRIDAQDWGEPAAAS